MFDEYANLISRLDFAKKKSQTKKKQPLNFVT